MTGATHFIKVWKVDKTNQVRETNIEKMKWLDKFINDTKNLGHITIAIWKTKDNGIFQR